MYVHVDLATDPATAELREREDCTRLHVEVHGATADAPGARPRLDQALRRSGFGTLDGGGASGEGAGADAGALLDLDALRAAAGRDRSPGWEQDFDKMIAYARSKGWVTPDDQVRAHLVWPATA